MTTLPRLILASASPRRRELLGQLGLPFEVVVAAVTEHEEPSTHPRTMVAHNAALKADWVAGQNPEAWVLGADTTVFIDDTVLNKPRDAAQARAMLRRLSGRTHTVLTGLALRHGASGYSAEAGETSEVTGAEDKIADACINDAVRAEFMKTFQDYQDFIIGTGADLLGSQPTQGNIRGGLTTIEEKALGNVEKMGRNPVVSVLKPAEMPQGPGVNFMDRSSAPAEMVTLCRRMGLDPAVALQHMGHSPYIGTGAMRLRVPFMIERQYEPATMKMVLWQKDMQVIGDMAHAVHCPTPLLDACRPIYTAALAMGLAEADTAATAEVLARMAGDVA
jgi:MAF protein